MDAGKLTIYDAARKGDFALVKWIVEYSRSSLNEFTQDHKTALHFAAMSGTPYIFRYLVDRCGLDPLQGDINLVTPWDIVHKNITLSGIAADKGNDSDHAIVDENYVPVPESDYCEIEKYLENKYSCKYEDFYRNPIRTGFFPDPSICRVGDDYYMANSSFIFFPCIPISHSKDLIHWEIIGHAITNPEWTYLDELEGGRGYWAPDISYYEGRFYITATYRLNETGPVYRRQIVVSSDKPEGPYTEPVFIDDDGIDPSIFNDDDGRRYMLLNRGARIFELDKTATKKISEPQLLYYGSNKRAPEGAHIYKKDGYYYLLQAEGGTGLGHMVTVSRSKELMGIYEPCPYNPIMRQKDEGAAIQRCGHGDMVETPDGRWYMVYLCGRQIGDGYSILGRETAIDPVTWTKDGWPIVNNLKGPSTMQVKPNKNIEFDISIDGDSDNLHVNIDKAHCEKLLRDGGDTNTCKDYNEDVINNVSKENPGKHSLNSELSGLPFDYMTPRPFRNNEVRFLSDEKGERFVIKGSKAHLTDIKSRNIVVRRQTSFKFEYSVTMDIPRLSEGQHLGITGYYDENTFLLFGIMKKDGANFLFAQEHIGTEDRFVYGDSPLPSGYANCDANEYNTAPDAGITLLMKTHYLKRDLYYKFPGMEDFALFTTLDNVYYLCDEGYNVGKRFTGALVGMYAYAGAKEALVATFNNPNYC